MCSADKEAAADSSSSIPTASGPSTLAAAAPAAVTAFGTTVPSTSTALKTAQALGVLGRIGSSAAAASSSSGGLHTLTQSDRDLIMGILGPGAMHLQLQPAGPAAGHLTGVAAEFRAAAREAQSTKRVFRGEIDLAVEISLMHQQQQHGGGGQQQYHQHGVDEVSSKVAAGSMGTDLMISYHQQQQQHPAEGHAAAAAAAVSSPRESFDIDDLLNWSQDNMG